MLPFCSLSHVEAFKLLSISFISDADDFRIQITINDLAIQQVKSVQILAAM